MTPHRTTPQFWERYNRLPEEVRPVADKNFALLKADASHPSLELKRIGRFWSARVGIHYRVLGTAATDAEGGTIWLWIGSHAEYDRIIAGQ